MPSLSSLGSLPSLWALVVRSAALRFAVKFAAMVGVWSLAYSFPHAKGSLVERWISTHLTVYARVAGAILKLFDPLVQVSGQQIIGRYALRIVKDCDAMEVTILFVSAVLSFPSSWPRRGAAIVLGTALIFAVNLLRICTLYFVGIHVPDAFEFAHRELWPLVMVVATAAAFLFWARHSPHPEVSLLRVDE